MHLCLLRQLCLLSILCQSSLLRCEPCLQSHRADDAVRLYACESRGGCFSLRLRLCGLLRLAGACCGARLCIAGCLFLQRFAEIRLIISAVLRLFRRSFWFEICGLLGLHDQLFHSVLSSFL